MRQRVCGRKDAEQRLADAKQFLEAAEILESPDVVALMRYMQPLLLLTF